MMPSELVVARLVRVIAHAVAVFGDEQKAANWLAAPQAILEDRAPAELFDSEEGIELVERTLIRIELKIPM
jgi:putative toxin-antitoxin system antitoxin component (TIGR02293 family)